MSIFRNINTLFKKTNTGQNIIRVVSRLSIAIKIPRAFLKTVKKKEDFKQLSSDITTVALIFTINRNSLTSVIWPATPSLRFYYTLVLAACDEGVELPNARNSLQYW